MSIFSKKGRQRVVRLLSPGVPSAILPGGVFKNLKPQAPVAQAKSTVTEFRGRTREDAVTALEVAPYVAAIPTGGASMSLWAGLANLGGAYLQYRTASKAAAQPNYQYSIPAMQTSSFMPAMAAMPAMGSLPPLLGRGALGAVGYGAGVMVARGRSIATAAGRLCLKHPAWCANIGGTAAIMAMMESGQIPIPKRRRGRGLTPRDLRSFRRVASLVRGFCPTVRRIPSRAIHARKTGIIHA